MPLSSSGINWYCSYMYGVMLYAPTPGKVTVDLTSHWLKLLILQCQNPKGPFHTGNLFRNLCKLVYFARKFLVWTNNCRKNKFRNFISQFRTYATLWKKFHLWSAVIGQSASGPVFTNTEWSTGSAVYTFDSLFPMWMCSLLKEKFRKFYFEIEFWNKFPLWKGPK